MEKKKKLPGKNKFLNKNIYKANSKYSDNSKIFWEKYKQTMNINESFAAATLGDNPVGLVMYGSNNYGSCATNLALYKAIENLGFKKTNNTNISEILNWTDEKLIGDKSHVKATYNAAIIADSTKNFTLIFFIY